MVDLGFMKLPLSGDFSVFKLLFGMACACLSIATVFASTELVGPALATSLEASRGGVDLEPLIAALKPAALVTLGWNVSNRSRRRTTVLLESSGSGRTWLY